MDALLHRCGPELDAANCARSMAAFRSELLEEGSCRQRLPASCGDLMDLVEEDCNRELSIGMEQRRMHLQQVDEVVEGLVEDCPAFRTSGWFLSCDQTPCVLGLSEPELASRGVSRQEAICHGYFTDGVETLTQYGSAILIPMYAVSGGDLGRKLEARWQADRNHRWVELSTFPGFGLSAFELEDGSKVAP